MLAIVSQRPKKATCPWGGFTTFLVIGVLVLCMLKCFCFACLNTPWWRPFPCWSLNSQTHVSSCCHLASCLCNLEEASQHVFVICSGLCMFEYLFVFFIPPKPPGGGLCHVESLNSETHISSCMLPPCILIEKNLSMYIIYISWSNSLYHFYCKWVSIKQ